MASNTIQVGAGTTFRAGDTVTVLAGGGASTPIIYSTVLVDSTSGYDPLTGIFTVSVPGYLKVGAALLNAGFTPAGVGTSLQLRLYHNAAVVALSFVSAEQTASSVVYGTQVEDIIYCNIGDTLHVEGFTDMGTSMSLSIGTMQNYFYMDKVS